ncbi:hypothetical protein BBO99_00000495 [Phytophthora kernoviae]|uniref:PX domain-containing protein n=2 Tax=Phytophthora kernoviae TaxID=325452 RepID=A0A3R7JC97_9STRA|nr:hypothetical protein JM16_000568 [Phytophthora kernoviae]KAG2533179.1 hypothetical protein JM18_000649 [Phytophthora kernoviae]RLN26101.1 hypothetical protein BBI17_000534 [Phytophthora kernoviae]RLN85424.1 hypothetical protein BBO99_00000495 [Phytophthora kernoviae]
MGCSQSKATDQVVERVSVDEDTPAPVEESAVEEAPVTEEETPASVEEAAKEAPAPVEEVVEEVKAPVEEAPVEEEVAPQEEGEMAAPVEEETAHVAEESPVEEEASVGEEAPVEAPTEEPKSEVAAVVEKPNDDVLTFTADEVTFNKGIAFYNYDGSNPQDPANDVHVSKRYSEFKALYAQLETLLADNQDDKSAQLPALPKASVLRRRNNKQMIEERKAQFTALLNAIARHPVASKSEAFANFLV